MAALKRALVWFRRDLRWRDNTALVHALKYGEVVPVLIFQPKNFADMGARRAAFFIASVHAFQKDLASKGVRLIIRKGKPVEELRRLAGESRAEAVFWNVGHEPIEREDEKRVVAMCRAAGLEFFPQEDSMIHAPEEVLKSDGKPYTVFTPYFRQWRNLKKRPVALYRENIRTFSSSLFSEPLPSSPSIDIPMPEIGEEAVRRSLQTFIKNNLGCYATSRDYPALDATSHLSAYLSVGSISARTVFHAVLNHRQKSPAFTQHVETFIKELAWRDFYKMILWHFPHAANGAWKVSYQHLKWENNPRFFEAWCQGRTGFPIVDAAMRQLNQTGWMHNRLRMIAASFLVKDLLINWQWGEQYFMRQLFDGDLAANNGGWQWCAGTGTDAQPYFRIFNPISQAKKFDPEGNFIEHYTDPSSEKRFPLVDHAKQRARALMMFRQISH